MACCILLEIDIELASKWIFQWWSGMSGHVWTYVFRKL